MPSTDTLIARLALSLWSSDRRVEPLPTVRVFEPHETVNLVPMRVSQVAWFKGAF